MQYGTERKIGDIRDFKGLIQYLRDELDWPLDLDEIEDLTFEYEPEELGLKPDLAVKVKEVKQLRPILDRQPWGIFWVEFENRVLPVTVMRQILRALVYKKRASAKAADRKAWHLKDLIFMSSLGEKGNRRINFSYFRETGEGEPTLQTFFWDEQETQFYWLDKNHLERLRWPADAEDVEGWRQQWASAFTAGYREPVRTAKDLSERLAALAANTRDAVLDVLRYESSAGPLHRLLESFQTVLLHDLDEAGFADMVAQTIAYGLFSARCTGQEVLGLAHLEAMVPNTNRFLKELFAELASISGHKRGQINFDDLGLSAMVTLLRDKNIEVVLEEFGRQAGGGKEDPVVHFYETFLSVYDKRQKIQRGVFYTPKPVVSFIVRSVHEILQKEFGLADGLADTTTWGEMAGRTPGLVIPKEAKASDAFVQILDPATGTGTFLEEVVEIVHATMLTKWKKQGKSLSAIRDAWNEYVPKHLLPRLRGFELMMAPYAVAHMKIGLKLRQTGYDFKSAERLRVYLTNTLEPPEKGTRKLSFLPDFLSHESMQADAVKERKAITVVIGNPPYSCSSPNTGDWIRQLIQPYKDGLNERKVYLDDDFIKFLRWTEWLLRRHSSPAVLGMITNNTYLDGLTQRRMRESLLKSFPNMWVVNLHGNLREGERTPDGISDENVFDILQGVAITLACHPKSNATTVSSNLKYTDVWGSRESKYSVLSEPRAFAGMPWQTIEPAPPYFFFVPRDTDIHGEYGKGFSIPEIFNVGVTGVQTKRDELVFDRSKAALSKRIELLRDASMSDSEIRRLFGVRDVGEWNLAEARRRLQRDSAWKSRFMECLYRPFEKQWLFYSGDLIARDRREVMRHMLIKNVGLVVTRQSNPTSKWSEILVCDGLVEKRALASYSGEARVYPLLLDIKQTLDNDNGGGINFTSGFIEEVRGRLSLALNCDEEARGVFHYLYAVGHSPSFRERYESQIKIDYVRFPLTRNRELFEKLSQIGADLVGLHLLDVDYSWASWCRPPSAESSPLSNLTSEFVSRGDMTISAGYPRYKGGNIYINESSFFKPVPEEVWDLEIGGYQACEKWLKDRRGENLRQQDVARYRMILASLTATRVLAKKIDKVIAANGGWPGAFAVPQDPERSEKNAQGGKR